ncbi:hypothetical protein DV515_00016292 [Chloebia gouldiae]|uniref:Uncharacterized protein n=1 Tax=Chloebia gouldiae TaxID=44316 RepID=A0A3L8RSW1_CHLGU|nr:hypothetical protein DV515_00016292 [Chloebia gouldiae]
MGSAMACETLVRCELCGEVGGESSLCPGPLLMPLCFSRLKGPGTRLGGPADPERPELRSRDAAASLPTSTETRQRRQKDRHWSGEMKSSKQCKPCMSRQLEPFPEEKMGKWSRAEGW